MKACAKIHLVDKCLILFMLILMLQSAYSLFFGSESVSEMSNIDVIVRTSSAGIFGYFLSANFIRHSRKSEASKITIQTQTGQIKDVENTEEGYRSNVQNKIGFEVSEIKTEIQKGNAEGQPKQSAAKEGDASDIQTASRLQIIVAASIGLFCLLSLLLFRNISECREDLIGVNTVAATVTQFRDFVSGCVGFLIGCPTNERN